MTPPLINSDQTIRPPTGSDWNQGPFIQPAILKKISVFTIFASFFSIFTGTMVLLGWFFAIPRFTHLLLKFESMKADTAVGFILLGLALFLMRKPFGRNSYVTFLKRIIEVKDNGIGMKKEDLPGIFGRFERFVRPSQYSGLGLGLYIVRQIVDAHHGKISVESELGKGSKFIIELPMRIRTKQVA